MKTSNKLLSSIIILIFLITIAAFVDLRVFGTHRNERKTPKHEISYQIGEFEHISFEQSFKTRWKPTIHLIKSDSNYLKFTYFKDSLHESFGHQHIGDTLIIKSLEENMHMYSLELFTNQEIATIMVSGTNMSLSGMQQDSIILFTKNGHIFNHNNQRSKACSFGKLVVEQENGTLQFHNCQVDDLVAILDQSKIRINNDVDIINASLKNQSELSVKNISEIQLKKDNTSRFNVY